MTIKELKEILIGSLRADWFGLSMSDNYYYIKIIRESRKDELESVLSEIESFITKNIDDFRELEDELSCIL